MRRVALIAAVTTLIAMGLPFADTGADAQTSEGAWNNLMVVYTGDVGGKIEPCG